MEDQQATLEGALSLDCQSLAGLSGLLSHRTLPAGPAVARDVSL